MVDVDGCSTVHVVVVAVEAEDILILHLVLRSDVPAVAAEESHGSMPSYCS